MFVNLGSTADHPMVTQLHALSAENPDVFGQPFEARPYVKLGRKKEVCGKQWDIELLSPFGSKFGNSFVVECQ